MPLTTSDILPRRPTPEIATGPVISTGVGIASIRVRPGLHVTVATAQPLAVGQMVSVAIPGGNLSAAQIIGGAAGLEQTRQAFAWESARQAEVDAAATAEDTEALISVSTLFS